jgi:hypothetical protein
MIRLNKVRGKDVGLFFSRLAEGGVGIHADKSASRFQALEPVRQGVRQHFGAIGKDVVVGLMLRHDHGPNYMSDDFQSEIAFLGIEASPAFVRRALHPHPQGEPAVGAPLRDHRGVAPGLLDFAAWYNTHRLVARHGHRTPAQIRADQQPALDQAA